jgi:glycosyltransferase involved in cell wall biosynthesis
MQHKMPKQTKSIKHISDQKADIYAPMKRVSVCMIVENLTVPLDRRVWSEALVLQNAGYAVSIICPKGDGPYASNYEVLDGIHIYRHSLWCASTKIGYIVEYGLALSAELYLMLKIFCRTKFKIIHGCNPPDAVFVLALLMRPFGVRYIFDHHDLAPELLEVKFGRKKEILLSIARFAEKCSFKTSTVSIATNESFRHVATGRGGKHPERVFIVRNCPDAKRLHPTSRTCSNSSGPLRVVYVGFMAQQDGLDLLLISIEHIVRHENKRNVEFVLVGGGAMLPELQSIVAQKSLESFVRFTGNISHDEVIEYLSKADIGVAPDPQNAVNDNSTMIKIMEYMAFGLPVVLFDLKEGRRSAGPAALYARPNDPIDLANQLIILMNNRELREKLGKCGRKRIEELMNWEREQKILLDAYQAALST